MTTVVVMPGGFHPFHAGHAALYQSARRAFPNAEVYVAATNDTSTRPFPFAVKEKLAKLAGVEPGKFIQVKSPFRANEIMDHFDPEKDQLIFVRSEKDAGQQPQPGGVKKDGSPSYLQPLESAKRLEPFARHAYMAYLPTVEFGPGMTSATEIRSAWPKLNDRRKTALVMSLYPDTQKNPALAKVVVKMLDAAITGSDKLDEQQAPSSQVLDIDRKKSDIIVFVNNILSGNIHRNTRDISPFYGIIAGKMTAGDAERIGFQDDVKKLWRDYFSSSPFIGGAPEPWSQINIGDQFARATGDDRTLNFYVTVNKDKENILNFFRNIQKLPSYLKPISIQYQTPIRFKTHSRLDSFVGHNDSLKIYYYDPKAKDPVTNAVKQWLSDSGIATGARSHEHGVDVKSGGGSFGQILGNHIHDTFTKLIQTHGNKYTPEQYFAWLKQNFTKLISQVQQKTNENQGWAAAYTSEESGQMAGTPAVGGMWAGYQQRENQPMDEDYIEEKWSQKYKRSINCSNPRGFSQRAHCAGRKK